MCGEFKIIQDLNLKEILSFTQSSLSKAEWLTDFRIERIFWQAFSHIMKVNEYWGYQAPQKINK